MISQSTSKFIRQIRAIAQNLRITFIIVYRTFDRARQPKEIGLRYWFVAATLRIFCIVVSSHEFSSAAVLPERPRWKLLTLILFISCGRSTDENIYVKFKFSLDFYRIPRSGSILAGPHIFFIENHTLAASIEYSSEPIIKCIFIYLIVFRIFYKRTIDSFSGLRKILDAFCNRSISKINTVINEAIEDVEMKRLCFFLTVNCLISITAQNSSNLFGCSGWFGKIDFTKQDSCIIEGCGDTIHKEDLVSQITIFAGFLGSCAGL